MKRQLVAAAALQWHRISTARTHAYLVERRGEPEPCESLGPRTVSSSACFEAVAARASVGYCTVICAMAMTSPTLSSIEFTPIGVIRTPHADPVGTPIQPKFAAGVRGTVLLASEYADALQDLAGFERIWLIYQFDRSTSWKPREVPFRDTIEHGLFATRAPNRPNPIGLSVVHLIAVRDATLVVEGVDMLDGSPLLDIKPYVPLFDAHPDARAGWFDGTPSERTHADNRYR